VDDTLLVRVLDSLAAASVKKREGVLIFEQFGMDSNGVCPASGSEPQCASRIT
jgi:hypothetical protein